MYVTIIVKFTGIYLRYIHVYRRSQVSVYRTIGPQVSLCVYDSRDDYKWQYDVAGSSTIKKDWVNLYGFAFY